MPMIQHYWLNHQQIEPFSMADVILATILSISVIAGIAFSIWIAVKEL